MTPFALTISVHATTLDIALIKSPMRLVDVWGAGRRRRDTDRSNVISDEMEAIACVRTRARVRYAPEGETGIPMDGRGRSIPDSCFTARRVSLAPDVRE